MNLLDWLRSVLRGGRGSSPQPPPPPAPKPPARTRAVIAQWAREEMARITPRPISSAEMQAGADVFLAAPYSAMTEAQVRAAMHDQGIRAAAQYGWPLVNDPVIRKEVDDMMILMGTKPTPTPAPGPAPEPPAPEPPAPEPPPPALPEVETTYYLSPTGNNANDGLSEGAPKKTFAAAFAAMSANDELVLLDGTYSTAAGTGAIYWEGTGSGQPPSGVSVSAPTVIRAKNPGAVKVEYLFIGRSFRKDSYIYVQGITFTAGGQLYNANYCTIKDCGFSGSFGIGTNDHSNGNEYNLIEDVWIWASAQRIIASNYQANKNVWRRVVIRGDGCSESYCVGSGNPNVGFTVYDCQDVLCQNVIIIDRILGGGQPYADFATAQHTPNSSYYLGRNKWQGCMSINSPDQAYNFEADDAVSPTRTMKDCIAWGGGGFNMGKAGSNDSWRNLTVYSTSDDAIRVAPDLSGTGGSIRDVVAIGAGRYAINSVFQPVNTSSYGSFTSLYNQTTPTGNVYTANPVAGGSILYPVRIETGSQLKGAGTSGADIGANVLYRLGVDGTRFGDSSVEDVTAVSLWPWPNEARIKAEMSVASTRGFCASGTRLDGVNPITLTSYIWELAGNAVPEEMVS